MIKELPVFEARINPDNDMFVDMVSIVATPAVATNNKEHFKDGNFLAFNENIKQEKLHFSDDDEMELFGIAMMANEHIYRRDPKTGEEYYVMFSADSIKEITINFSKNKFNNNVNVEHSNRDAKSVVFESFIVDSKKDKKAPAIFGEVPDGSWLIGVKVFDKELWQEIKQGKRTGFSVEGLFELFDRDVWVEVETDEKFNKVDIDITGWALHDTQIKASINQLEYYINKLKED